MKRHFVILAFVSLLGFVIAAPSYGTPFWGAVDLSGLGEGTEFELEFQLFGGGDADDAEVLIDNISIGDMLIDFEIGHVGDYLEEDLWNASDTVDIVSGSLDGTGSRVLSLVEDPDGGVFTTIVYQSFIVPTNHPPDPCMLRFDYETLRFETGFFEDQFTAWLRNSSGEALLIPGVAYEEDPVVLEVTPTFGVQHNPNTTTAVIPEPTTILLVLSGLGGIAAACGNARRRRRVSNGK